MSKGSKIVPVRIPPLMLAAVDAAIKSANKHTRGAPYTRSSWILVALAAKLSHCERGKRYKHNAASQRHRKLDDSVSGSVDSGSKTSNVPSPGSAEDVW